MTRPTDVFPAYFVLFGFFLGLISSPSSLSYEDTYNTLKYADRAKSIKSSLVKNVVSVDLHVSRYPKLVKELQSEVKNCMKSMGTSIFSWFIFILK